GARREPPRPASRQCSASAAIQGGRGRALPASPRRARVGAPPQGGPQPASGPAGRPQSYPGVLLPALPREAPSRRRARRRRQNEAAPPEAPPPRVAVAPGPPSSARRSPPVPRGAGFGGGAGRGAGRRPAGPAPPRRPDRGRRCPGLLPRGAAPPGRTLLPRAGPEPAAPLLPAPPRRRRGGGSAPGPRPAGGRRGVRG